MYRTFFSSTIGSNKSLYFTCILLEICMSVFQIKKKNYRQVVHTYIYKEGLDLRIVAKKVMHIPDPHPTSRQMHGLS